MGKRAHQTPADLHRELAWIRRALFDLRVDTQRLRGEFVWLSADHLDAFGGALVLASDAARLAIAHTDRMT